MTEKKLPTKLRQLHAALRERKIPGTEDLLSELDQVSDALAKGSKLDPDLILRKSYTEPAGGVCPCCRRPYGQNP